MSRYGDRRVITEALVCAAAGALAFLNSLGGGFVWDDIYLVVKNPYVKGIANLPTLFTTGYWASLGKTGGLYRPLTMLSFLVENAVAGVSPWLYHLDNLILNSLAAVLVYLIARRVINGADTVAPLLAGLIFAVHPVHTEAVSWVSGRAELLSSVFFMAAFLAFLHPTRRVVRQEVSAGLFLLGLLCKETAVTLPAVVLLYMLLVRRERGLRPLAASVLPYVLVLATYVPVRLAVLGGHAGPQTQMFAAVSGYHTFLTMMKAGFQYVRLTLFPTGLQVAYVFPPVGSIMNYQVAGFIIAILLLAVMSWRLYRTRPVVLYFILWFIVTLLPVSNLIPTEVIMTERALYLPSAGACILLGALFARAYSVRRVAAMMSVLVVLAAFTALTVNRTPVWGNDRLFQTELLGINKRLVHNFPDQPEAYTKLADSYVALGEISRAGPLYERALSLYPDDCGALYGLGNAYKSAGRLEDALRELKSALECGYDRPSDIHGNIAAILYEMGELDESEKQLEAAIKLDPYEPRHRVNLGYILQKRGDLKGAIETTRLAADMAPGNYMARYRLGMLYGELEDFGEAIWWLKQAVVLEPGNVNALFYLGAAYEASGDIQNAKREYEAVIKADPGNQAARARLEIMKGR